MASNINVSYPPAVGAATPPTELKYFGNESASTKDSLINYVTTALPTTPVTCYPHNRDLPFKGISEYPR